MYSSSGLTVLASLGATNWGGGLEDFTPVICQLHGGMPESTEVGPRVAEDSIVLAGQLLCPGIFCSFLSPA